MVPSIDKNQMSERVPNTFATWSDKRLPTTPTLAAEVLTSRKVRGDAHGHCIRVPGAAFFPLYSQRSEA